MLIPDQTMPATPAQIRRRRIVALAALAGVLLFVVVFLAALGAGGAVTANAIAAPRVPVTIQWVGDITPGSSAGVPPGDGSAQFAGVLRKLRSADLTIGNLEGTYSVGGDSKCGTDGDPATCFAFQAPPQNAVALRKAGFDAVNLANNHAWDYGADGQRQTADALRRAGVAASGRPGEITIVRARGMRIALMGYAAYPWAGPIRDLVAARAQIAEAARRSDYVVVAMHAGGEGADQTHVPQGTEEAFGEDRGDSRAFAHAAIDAGADLVVGSGPHVIRGVERYKGRPIAYSLGNFAGWRNFGQGGRLSLSGILNVELAQDGAPTGGRWISMKLTGPGIPRPDPSHASAHLAAELSRQDFGRNAGMSSDGALKPEP